MKSDDLPPCLEGNIVTTKVDDISDFFEIEKCCSWCKQYGFVNVALQFPDNLLSYSPSVLLSLSLSLPLCQLLLYLSIYLSTYYINILGGMYNAMFRYTGS